jgi:hypothetical protein
VIWASWRQQRTETLIAAGMLTLLAALLVPTGLHMASVYDHEGLAGCLGTNNFGLPTNTCRLAIDSFSARFEHLGGLLTWFNLIPGLIGVLLAAPLLLELETGTHRLAWTQSITRSRWITAKLGVTLGTALLAALALTLLMTWWRGPLDHLHGRLDTNVFDFEGTVSIGYVFFGLGLALAVGVVWRRTVPALVVGFAGYIAARIFVQSWLRQRYRAPITSVTAIGARGPNLHGAWVLVGVPSDKHGHQLPDTANLIQSCARAVNSQIRTLSPGCLAQHGAGYNLLMYQPASRFWLFQGIETALFAGTALALIAFSAWWLHERTS